MDGKQYRALIADDSEDIRELMARTLMKLDFKCDQAPDGVVAENLMRTNEYDVIVVDLRMPRKNGHQLLTEVLAQEKRPLAVAITGVLEPKLLEDLMKRGIDDFVQKPFDFQLIAVKIQALLRRKEMGYGAASKLDPRAIKRQLSEATNDLKQQLGEMTASFQQTIKNLEKEQEDLESGFVGSLRVLSTLMNQVGKGSHASRVEDIACFIAQRLKADAKVVRAVRIGALMHDIGKFGMPDSVLSKPPWTLDGEMREMYERYPLIGAALLSEVRGAEDAVALIESHAECYNGNGFPFRRKGHEIPLGARIIRLADGYDTFCMYESGENLTSKLLEHLRMQEGKAHDPALTKYAIAFLQEKEHERKVDRSTILRSFNLYPGCILAEDVYDSEGHFLLRKGACLNETILQRLAKLLHGQNIRVVEPAKPRQ